MKKQKSLDELKYYQEFYQRICCYATPTGQMLLNQHISKLKQKIQILEQKKSP
jgi:hypothetical protein